MYTRREFENTAAEIMEKSPYPAVKYKIMRDFLGKKFNDTGFNEIYRDFKESDIVSELAHEQLNDGSWGHLIHTDYSVKRKIINTCAGVSRCCYIGLSPDYDAHGIAESALEYLKKVCSNEIRIPMYEKNERAPHVHDYTVAGMIESMSPHDSLCDDLWNKWSYIALRSFESGEYNYEADFKAQNQVFGIKGKRLIPHPLGFILSRRKELAPFTEPSMLDYYGTGAYYHGYFWPEPLSALPDSFKWEKTHRLVPVIERINCFANTKYLLGDVMEWLIQSRGDDGFWDWGKQMPDPFGYRRYMSLTKSYNLNRKINCSIEILSLLKTYIDNNSI